MAKRRQGKRTKVEKNYSGRVWEPDRINTNPSVGIVFVHKAKMWQVYLKVDKRAKGSEKREDIQEWFASYDEALKRFWEIYPKKEE